MEFRAAAFLEARECLKVMGTQEVEQPEFWANLLGAIANASIAAVPDTVAAEAYQELAHRDAEKRQFQKAMQMRITEKLNGK